ncbi:MAG: hypothetical protein ABIO94_01945 [Opitutaceae bacterium]
MLEVARADAETKEATGPELFHTLLREAQVTQELSTIASYFSPEVAAIGAPLTSEQTDALARVLAENKQASQRGTLATPEEAEAALLENVGKVLSPAQFDFFRRSRAEDAQFVQLNRKLSGRK